MSRFKILLCVIPFLVVSPRRPVIFRNVETGQELRMRLTDETVKSIQDISALCAKVRKDLLSNIDAMIGGSLLHHLKHKLLSASKELHQILTPKCLLGLIEDKIKELETKGDAESAFEISELRSISTRFTDILQHILGTTELDYSSDVPFLKQEFISQVDGILVLDIESEGLSEVIHSLREDLVPTILSIAQHVQIKHVKSMADLAKQVSKGRTQFDFSLPRLCVSGTAKHVHVKTSINDFMDIIYTRLNPDFMFCEHDIIPIIKIAVKNALSRATLVELDLSLLGIHCESHELPTEIQSVVNAMIDCFKRGQQTANRFHNQKVITAIVNIIMGNPVRSIMVSATKMEDKQSIIRFMTHITDVLQADGTDVTKIREYIREQNNEHGIRGL